MPFIQRTINTQNFVQVGEMVNLPRHKLVGKVTDKLYKLHDLQPLRIVVEIDYNMSRDIYGGLPLMNKITVESEELKSLKANVMYSKIAPIVNIPNLLEYKDIKKGNIVRIVDNYMIEKMLTYDGDTGIIFYNFNINNFINKEVELTGVSTTIGRHYEENSISVVQCRFDDGRTYYMYRDCIQLVKRINIFMKIKKIYKKIYVVIDNFLDRVF